MTLADRIPPLMPMSQWRIDLAKQAQAIKAHDPDATDATIAESLRDAFAPHVDDPLNQRHIRNARRDYRRHLETTITSPAYAKQNKQYNTVTIDRYDIVPTFAGDYMLIGDVHLPSTNWKLCEVMLQVARAHLRKPKFIIMGDLFNLDSLSSYETVVPVERLETEIALARGFLEAMMSIGDVFVFAGNHEYRWSRRLDAVTDIMHLWELVQHGMKDGSIRFYRDTFAWLRSGSHKWLACHQRNYSKIKLRVAGNISLLRQTNVITFHEHHVASGVSDNALHATVNNGGLHEAPAMHYVNQYISTSPRMSNGFNMVRDGTCHKFTPYSQLTDWGMWGIDASDVLVWQAKKDAIYTGDYVFDEDSDVVTIQR